ncbi:MAG: hypothetical protein EZS28_048148, partial [Streblomastix strix]
MNVKQNESEPNLEISSIKKDTEQQTNETISVSQNDITETQLIEEPDLSDLESTSYDSSEYEEDQQQDNKPTTTQIKQKLVRKKKKKNNNSTFNQDNRRTPRIQAEDFQCYACRITRPKNELELIDNNNKNGSSNSIEKQLQPQFPYNEKKSVSGTNLLFANVDDSYCTLKNDPVMTKNKPQFCKNSNHGEMCLVMRQGRRMIQQTKVPKEMPFTNAIRILQLSAYPSGGVYVKQPTDVII